ncbi:sugar ABC transporter ATP-binding protein [Pseudarthrobacter sp. B4EP4b]|uniref:sugar ABC transporter ATP-binding protein n=1 Tax=Pseudarthrobacter sp. B4EP4b TaxID=2590664 RepID=UPI001154E24D|nr:sugar ABC transporter ATP-binding protein [Pseudarthrobacter sp. B4EP4b]
MLEINSLVKKYPGTTALNGVSLSISSGEVVAIAGENGSGKSTLMKIIAGHLTSDSGQIQVDGKAVKFTSPSDAVAAGIGLVEQELAVAHHLTVAENILLGALPRRRGIGLGVDWAQVRKSALEIMDVLGIDVDPKAIVGQLPINLQQLVAIGSVLSRRPRLMLLDEATSSLSEDETDRLMGTLRRLKDNGMGIVFISHRMREMREIADRIVVLRDGSVSGAAPMQDVSDGDVVKMLVGRVLDNVFTSERTVSERIVLQTGALCAADFIEDITMTVHAGEVVGLAGLMGSGRSTLSQTIFGAVPPTSGTVRIDGREVRFTHPAQALDAGVGFVGENRKAQGIFPGRSVRENLCAANLAKNSQAGVMSATREKSLTRQAISKFGVKCTDIEGRIEALSGGNQQKVLLARSIVREPKLLILDEPTRGVDVGAKGEIYEQIAQAAAKGMGFLVASSELTELIGLCDTIYVLSQGRIVGQLDRESATEERIASLAFHSEQAKEVA